MFEIKQVEFRQDLSQVISIEMIRYVILSLLVMDFVCWVGSIFVSPKLNIVCPMLSMTVVYIIEYVSFEYDDFLGMSHLIFINIF